MDIPLAKRVGSFSLTQSLVQTGKSEVALQIRMESLYPLLWSSPFRRILH
jgi:hypothetical protein